MFLNWNIVKIERLIKLSLNWYFYLTKTKIVGSFDISQLIFELWIIYFNDFAIIRIYLIINKFEILVRKKNLNWNLNDEK